MSLFLGVDTSNYTTSMSLCRDGEIILNMKRPVFVADGMRGTRQSDAIFSHTKNIPEMCGELEKHIDEKISAVGVSSKPRDAEGSYMPCFLSGMSIASAFSAAFKAPVYSFSHQRGHIAAALYSSGMLDIYGKNDFLAYHMSGGTSEVLKVAGDSIKIIGGTRDLTAGQLIDRTGVMLGLAFPCGNELEKLALRGTAPENIKISVDGCYAHFSGAENKAKELSEKGEEPENIAAYAIEFIRATLDTMTGNVIKEYGAMPLVFSGGVMSCSIISKYFIEKYGAHFADPQFSSDNAAGIAILAEMAFKKDRV